MDILTRSNEATNVNLTQRFVKFLFEMLDTKFEGLENADGDEEITSIFEDINRYLQELKEVTCELLEEKKDPTTHKFVHFLFEIIGTKYDNFDSADSHKDLTSIVGDINVFLLKLKEVTRELI